LGGSVTGVFSKIHIKWLLMQTFYHGLTQKARECLDASAKGSFLELTIGKAEILLDKIAENQS